MRTIFENLVNGNFSDARERAKHYDETALCRYAMQKIGWSESKSWAAAQYLVYGGEDDFNQWIEEQKQFAHDAGECPAVGKDVSACPICSASAPKLSVDRMGEHAWIIDSEGNYIAELVTEDDEGRCLSGGAVLDLAREIVKAHNEHAALVAVAAAAKETLRELDDFIFSAITNQKGFQNSDLFYRATNRAKKQQKALANLAAVREGGAQ